MESKTIPEQKSHVWIKDIREKDRISDHYLVKEKKLGTTRRGDPFLTLTLSDKTGDLAAKIWDGADKSSSLFNEGDILKVTGVADSYRSQIQLTVSSLKVIDGPVDRDIFFESSPIDPSKMMGSLRKILNAVKDEHLKKIIHSFLCDQDFISRFKQAPAAKNFHHSYLGGLLEHTLSVCIMAKSVAGHYKQLNGDLLITGAFLHDIGKTREFKFNQQIDYSDEGRLLGHIVIGTNMLDEKLRELKNIPSEIKVRLKHLILSHHGEYEFGSPKRPKFLEAFALCFIDDLDAKMNGLDRFMQKDQQDGAWTDFNRLFNRFFLKGIIPSHEDTSEERGGSNENQQMLFSATPEP